MSKTIEGSALPDQCPLCGSEHDSHEWETHDNAEGATYLCGLELYVEGGRIELEYHCEGAIIPWLRKRNTELEKAAANPATT
jgi:hypothetical protein